MTRVSASLEVAVPPSLCIAAIQQTLADDRLLAAAHALRPGKQYNGFVETLVPDRRVVIAFAALEPGTGKRIHAFGWKVTYDFEPSADGRTRVTVSIEYPLLAALGGVGTMRPQAENDIMHRLSAIVALETGVHGARRPA